MAARQSEDPWLTATLAYIDYYKDLAEKAIDQLSDDQLHQRPDHRSNSIAIYMHHLGGNHLSRFTDLFESDGEKPWRDRDAELDDNGMSRDDLLDLWERGWATFRAAAESLESEDAERLVQIRGKPHTVSRALVRALTHAAYHCGQIVTTAKLLTGDRWRTITIAPGGTAAYNASLGYEPASE